MNDMVERVARAICTEYGFPNKPFLCYEHALAAIAAMREPTPEMLAIEEFECTMPYGEVIVTTNASQNYGIWRAMIDAALAEK